MTDEQTNSTAGLQRIADALRARAMGEPERAVALVTDVTETGEAAWMAAYLLEVVVEMVTNQEKRRPARVAARLNELADGVEEDLVGTQVGLIVNEVSRQMISDSE